MYTDMKDNYRKDRTFLNEKLLRKRYIVKDFIA